MKCSGCRHGRERGEMGPPGRAERMRRREVIGLLGGAAAWPVTAHAQQSQPARRIAVLVPLPEAVWAPMFNELRQHGYVEGESLAIDRRGFDARYDQFPTIVADLISASPDAILCGGTPQFGPCRPQLQAFPSWRL